MHLASEPTSRATRPADEEHRCGSWVITRNWKTARGNRPQPDEFTFVHDDYDGPEDGRCGAAVSLYDALCQIKDINADRAARAARHREHQRAAAAAKAAHIADLKATVAPRRAALACAFRSSVEAA